MGLLGRQDTCIWSSVAREKKKERRKKKKTIREKKINMKRLLRKGVLGVSCGVMVLGD